MKRALIITFFIFLIIISGCSSEKKLVPDSPENLSILASSALKTKNYEELKSYFTEAKRDLINNQYFQDLNGLNSPGTEIKTFSYLKINNQILLLDIIKEPGSKIYQIQNIIKVPKEYEDLFNNDKN